MENTKQNTTYVLLVPEKLDTLGLTFLDKPLTSNDSWILLKDKTEEKYFWVVQANTGNENEVFIVSLPVLIENIDILTPVGVSRILNEGQMNEMIPVAFEELVVFGVNAIYELKSDEEGKQFLSIIK